MEYNKDIFGIIKYPNTFMNSNKELFEDETLIRYFKNVCESLLYNYNHKYRKYNNCNKFYKYLDYIAILEVRDYGVPFRMFQPATDRIYFHVGDLDSSIKHKCSFEYGTLCDDGFLNGHSEEEKKKFVRYSLDIAKIFKSQNFEVALLCYNIDGKGYLDLKSSSNLNDIKPGCKYDDCYLKSDEDESSD